MKIIILSSILLSLIFTNIANANQQNIDATGNLNIQEVKNTESTTNNPENKIDTPSIDTKTIPTLDISPSVNPKPDQKAIDTNKNITNDNIQNQIKTQENKTQENKLPEIKKLPEEMLIDSEIKKIPTQPNNNPKIKELQEEMLIDSEIKERLDNILKRIDDINIQKNPNSKNVNNKLDQDLKTLILAIIAISSILLIITIITLSKLSKLNRLLLMASK